MTGKLQNTITSGNRALGKVARPKRDVIIETTVELFRRTHDVRKVSIEDIALAARVSPTTIYNQFGSRDALVVETAKSLIVKIGVMAQAVMQSDLPFDQKLVGIVTGKIALASAASDEVIAKLLSQDKAIAPFIEEMFRNVAWPMWRGFLAEGKSQGFINPELDEEVFLEYLDIIRIGFGAKKDLLVGWKENLGKLQQLTNIAFYGFLKKDINLFGENSYSQTGDQRSSS
jgi:AcrR family transcriptional regulator